MDHLPSTFIGAVYWRVHARLLDPGPQRVGVSVHQPDQLRLVFVGTVAVDVEVETVSLLHGPLVRVRCQAHPVARRAHTGPQLSAPGRL